MKRNKSRFWFLLLSILFLTGITYLIIFNPPEKDFNFLNFTIPNIVCFFVLIFLFFFCLISFLFKTVKHGVFISFLIVSILLLFLYKLAHIYFILLLIALFILMEFLFKKEA